MVNVNDTERYEGGNSENVALVIRSTEKQDIGNYTCQLSNSIGKGVSEQQIDLDVQCKFYFLKEENLLYNINCLFYSLLNFPLYFIFFSFCRCTNC